MIPKISELFDMEHTIAAELFEGKEYPWEVLGDIKDFILKLGPTLPRDEFDNPSEGIWIAKDAKVYPSAYIGAPCIIDHGAEVRHCAFIRESAIVGKNSVVGNSCEVKNAVIFDNCEVPH
ncbi:MAG: UDP-N-acetylglucosamine pyrophosphorylase, partial [Firmicutes bacterium]|nr:UDP-N-acetylglucosamine pyrophosphorylase [Bacillota bacterium]